MTWNHDLTTAPRGKTETTTRKVGKNTHTITDFIPDVLLLATKCGKVVRSYWIPENGKNPGRWSGLATGEYPDSWALWPRHPFRAKAGEEATDTMLAASIDPVSRTDDESDRQRSSMVELADDCRQGGNEDLAAAVHPAPLIIHKHIFLDDVGGGA